MGIRIGIKSREQREAEMVDGVFKKDYTAQNKLYAYCADYYYTNYRKSNLPKDMLDEIFQSSFIVLWEKIANQDIAVKDGTIVIGKEQSPLNASIRTYFIAVTNNKYKEWLYEHPYYSDPNTEAGKEFHKHGFDEAEYMKTLYGNSRDILLDILTDAIAHMSARCNEILTKFYYEGKNLDRILEETPSIESKNALKSKKNKCMNSLRSMANEIYNRYINS